VGTPIANRTRAEIENLIGFFVNTLVMKADFSSSLNFRELVQQVKTTALEAYAHQDVPFEMLVDRIQPDREMSHSPLFQVVFSLQNNQITTSALDIGDIQIAAVEADTRISKFDLTLTIAENGNRLLGAIEFNTDLFTPGTISRMQDHFLQLLDQAFTFPDQPLDGLVMVTEKERQTILEDWNQTLYPIEDEAGVQELFTRNARMRPDAPAVVFGDQELTYSNLDEKATILAKYLLGQGIKPESVVGVCLEKSPEVIVSLLGILKAGAVYLPLDPAYPSSRINYMVDDITQW
jgi:non-ribosomal peptide synthetase component F